MSRKEELISAYQEHLHQMVQRSWCLQDKYTRKHRLSTVIALAIELEDIKKVNRFSTAFGEQAIEAVIQGDWRELEEVAKFLTFESEIPDIRDQFKPLWEKFRTLALTACAEEKRRVPGQGSEAH